MKKIAVIGAGITGVTTAYALVVRGFEVTVFDRNRYILTNGCLREDKQVRSPILMLNT